MTSEENTRGGRWWSRRLGAGAGLLVAFLLAAYLVLDIGGDDIACSDFRFDATAWASDADGDEWVQAREREEPTVRQRLADGLIECGTLVGKRDTELTRILGEPDNYVVHDPVVLVHGREAASWRTGIERGYIAIDNEHLLIRFGADGRAESAELVTD